MKYEVDLDLFKGPLDLLLYLVRKEEISIREIEICRITDQYLEYLEAMKALELEVSGDFIVMASLLMRLKARELLPQSEREQMPEDEDFIDRERLIRQIEEYERFRDMAGKFKMLESEHFGTFYRTKVEGVAFSQEDFLDQKDVEIFDLLTSFKSVLEGAKKDPVYFMDADNVTIDDRIEHVISEVTEHKKIRFADIFKDDARKIVIVVTFMAILELMKMQHISISQDEHLGELWLTEREQEEESLSSEVSGPALI